MALSNAQLQIAVAALARNLVLPSPTSNQTGVFRGSGNQLQIPISGNAQGLYNSQLGSNLNISADANYIYVGLNIGDPMSGA